MLVEVPVRPIRRATKQAVFFIWSVFVFVFVFVFVVVFGDKYKYGARRTEVGGGQSGGASKPALAQSAAQLCFQPICEAIGWNQEQSYNGEPPLFQALSLSVFATKLQKQKTQPFNILLKIFHITLTSPTTATSQVHH